MIPMKRVLKKYSLVLDTKTDKSHLIKTPVNFEEPNSTFIIEADFCEKWLILNELKN